jgi:hypothetical protein
MKTLEEQLEDVQQAIAKAETMQEYRIKDRMVRYASDNTLEILYKRETTLMNRIARRDAISSGFTAGRISKCDY